ncbi:MAG: type II secretion system protein M [Betaproteobacteria bacterium]|nr:type II secretion system protein M [Betaproteobacteria bacterium]
MKSFDWQQAIVSLWRARSLRERAVLGALAALLLALVVYGLFWQPAMENIGRLQQELPLMRSELARLQAMAAELNVSRKRTAVAVPAGAELETALRQSLRDMGLPTQKFETRPDGRIMLEWHDAPFSTMADWLDQVRQKWRVSVVEAHVERALHPGDVNAHLVLRGGG